jgi:hypothetical protein
MGGDPRPDPVRDPTGGDPKSSAIKWMDISLSVGGVVSIGGRVIAWPVCRGCHALRLKEDIVSSPRKSISNLLIRRGWSNCIQCPAPSIRS